MTDLSVASDLEDVGLEGYYRSSKPGTARHFHFMSHLPISLFCTSQAYSSPSYVHHIIPAHLLRTSVLTTTTYTTYTRALSCFFPLDTATLASVVPESASVRGKAPSRNGNGHSVSVSGRALQVVRALSSDLVNRVQFAVRAGLAWGMSRRVQLYQVLGYETRLTIQHYRALYERDGLAQRIVDLPPAETWVAGFQVVEDENPEVETEFEKAAADLCERLTVPQVMLAADRLAGLGHYSGVLIGAGRPGQVIDLSTPLPNNIGGPDNIIYLTPFAEDNCRVTKLDTNPASDHYGQPLTYEIVLGLPVGGVQFDGIFGLSQNSLGEVVPNVHWTRVIHIAEKAHENKIYGVPRLRAVYDYLEALFKVVHGGAEGAWRRMDPGIYIDIDPEVDIRPDPATSEGLSDEDAEAAAIRQVEEKARDYYQGMNRFIVGRGMQVTPLNANVKDYGANSDTLLKLIAASTGIPLRILTGSEMGKLASDQDRENANDRASERRLSFAEGVVRQFIDRLVKYGGLPKPKLNNGKYMVQWGEAQKELTETEKATVTASIALANSNQANAGDTIILTSSEIREKVWGFDPLEPDQLPEPPEPPPAPVVVAPGSVPGTGEPNGQPNDQKPGTPQAQLPATKGATP